MSDINVSAAVATTGVSAQEKQDFLAMKNIPYEAKFPLWDDRHGNPVHGPRWLVGGQWEQLDLAYLTVRNQELHLLLEQIHTTVL